MNLGLLNAPALAQTTTSTTAEDDAMGTSSTTWLASLALGAAASTTAVATTQSTPTYAIGVCNTTVYGYGGVDRMGAQITPTVAADSYMVDYQNKSDSPLKKYASDKYSFDEATTRILVAPKHGELLPTDGSNVIWRYTYAADKGFYGKDTFVIQVEKYGIKINVHYTIEVLEPGEAAPGYCTPEEWKIS